MGRLSELQAFRTWANMHNGLQICHPRGHKLGTRYLSGQLANTTEGNFILAQLLAKCIIEFIGQHPDTLVEGFLAVLLVFLQSE